MTDKQVPEWVRRHIENVANAIRKEGALAERKRLAKVFREMDHHTFTGHFAAQVVEGDEG